MLTKSTIIFLNVCFFTDTFDLINPFVTSGTYMSRCSRKG